MLKKIISIFSICLSLSLNAEINLYPLFTDNAVLQRDINLPVFGTGKDDSEVTVRLGDQIRTTKVKNGKWKVYFEPMAAGGTHTLTAKSNGKVLKVSNLLIGDVWLCTGQSNMGGLLGTHVNKFPDVLQGEPGDYTNENIRLLKIKDLASSLPEEAPVLDEKFQSWKICDPKSSLLFSTTGYFFGKHLQKQIDVPIGLIHTNLGGTAAESWTPAYVLENNDSFRSILDNFERVVKNYPIAEKAWRKKLEAYESKLDAWFIKKEAGNVGEDLGKKPKRPGPPMGPNHPKRPSGLYNAMIAPLHAFPIKGAIWYQGEANSKTYARCLQYEKLLPAMVESWRDKWALGDFPFILVQLAAYKKVSDNPQDTEWSWMRESMSKIAERDPNIGIACIIDGGMQEDIHPPYKEMAGSRLALQARKIAYGQDIECSGPTFKSMHINKNKIEITFSNVGTGLKTKSLALDRGAIMVNDKTLKGFTICSEDKQFKWAQAKIIGENTVEVWHDNINKPISVRYAWADFPLANLYNSADLPTLPFRTDKFEVLD